MGSRENLIYHDEDTGLEKMYGEAPEPLYTKSTSHANMIDDHEIMDVARSATCAAEIQKNYSESLNAEARLSVGTSRKLSVYVKQSPLKVASHESRVHSGTGHLQAR